MTTIEAAPEITFFPRVEPSARPPATVDDVSGFTRTFEQLRRGDIGTAGGKGANLGEMTSAGLPVPAGYVVTIAAYERFAGASGLRARIEKLGKEVRVENPSALHDAAEALRQLVLTAEVPPDVRRAIVEAYGRLAPDDSTCAVAVRSSATAEDTAAFSFAGMHESFLEVRGAGPLVEKVRACWASAYGARAIFYRLKHGFPVEMGLAVVVQRMVASVKSGVIFTADPTSRDPGKVVIEAAWGLGEVVVGGQVTPDHYVLEKSTLAVVERVIARKEFLLEPVPQSGGTRRVDLANDPRASAPVLDDAELSTLGDFARRCESHYGSPQDLEFAIDGHGAIFLTQTRPITTLGAAASAATASGTAALGPATDPADSARQTVHGLGASPGVAVGRVRVLRSVDESSLLQRGEILVAHMTAPDWVPLMRQAGAVVTDSGGMTSHAAIVSRELGIPCVVGTSNATLRLRTGTVITVDGEAGTVVEGDQRATLAEAPAAATRRVLPAATAPITATKLYVNLAQPDRAVEIAARDVDGVGLLRAEFMLLEALEGTHPLEFVSQGHGDEFVQRMAAKLGIIAGAFHPRPVIYRATDFRSNEFRKLVGGEAHEPVEENPMIGYRGCYRYVKDPALFQLELRALHEVRRKFPNLHLMIPFVRTGWEFRECKRLIDASALGADRTLQLWIMAEVPSVVSWLAEYAALGATGVSIGSNDLTQLTLGVDRDSDIMAPVFDERDRAVTDAIRAIVTESHRLKMTCSICGQAPSVYPEYAEFLVRAGIDSISVNPDAIERTRRNVAVAERKVILDAARSARS